MINSKGSPAENPSASMRSDAASVYTAQVRRQPICEEMGMALESIFVIAE